MTNRKDYCTMNMMKKKYIAPAIEVVEMETVSVLAGSIVDGGQIGVKPGEAPDEELSNRRRNYWNEVGSDRGW